MLQATCEICGQPATIQETTVEGEGAVTRHLGQEHGAAAAPPIDHGPQALRAGEGQFRRLSEAE
jgi:hypothetical protein